MKRSYVRLTEPLVRDHGHLRPATWEEALERAAQGFRTAVDRHGPRTFVQFSCSKATAARTTCRGAAIWGRCPTACRASSTSRIRPSGPDLRRPGGKRSRRTRYGAPYAPQVRDHHQAGHHADPEPGTAANVAQAPKIDNELYVRDYSRCILCYKCVEACGTDAQNTFAIAVAGRGFEARISTEFAVPLPDSACVYCGNCIGVCPTGALIFRSEHTMRQAGTWDETAQTQPTPSAPIVESAAR